MSGIPTQAWGLIGVILGFSIGEGARWVRQMLRIRRLKQTVRTELNAVLAQIEDKKDILKQAVQALQQKSVLPMAAVRSISIGYNSYIEELYEHISDIDRNCLHVIYEQLRVADLLTESFHGDFQRALKDKTVDEPWEAYVAYLNDLAASYDVVRSLIRSFLAGEAEDVFHIRGRRSSG